MLLNFYDFPDLHTKKKKSVPGFIPLNDLNNKILLKTNNTVNIIILEQTGG